MEIPAADPSQIRLLPSDVVDQIAAGEVVERPAHLVKELVENAIDAGATTIEIEYDQGGRRVRVTDDGRGIVKEQLGLALARHATSKIESAQDLWSLSTFGFRGEALASIAAVSRLTMQSRTGQAETASRVIAEFGRLSPVEPTGGNPGTTVLVEELFSNIPARLKFLKSEMGESSQIKATLKALALANPTVEFRLRTKGKTEAIWSRADDFIGRVKQVVAAENLYENTMELAGYRTHVVFASPHEVTGNARSIQIFVQGRWVQDRSLQAAVTEAYRGLLMHGEYPIAVVSLQVPPDEIDVNIHPTKSQVKFRDSQAAFRSVNRTLREGLERAPWLAKASASSDAYKAGVTAAVEASAQAAAQKKLSVADLTRPYVAHSTLPGRSSDSVEMTNINQGTDFSKAPVFSTARFESPEFDTISFRQKADQKHDQTAGPKAELNGILENSVGAPSAEAIVAAPTVKVAGAWSRLQVLGQANLTYIVAQDEGRLVLVDQHAAHERVAYERLMQTWMSGQIDVQPLLIPLSIDLEGDGAEALMSVSSDLERLGVQVDQSGPQSIAVRAKPALIKESALAKALSELAREISERGGSFALEKKISDLCATMACHSVVRAGQALSYEQMKSLLAQMDEFALSSFCPHGRPVSVDYPFSRLERDFGRLV